MSLADYLRKGYQRLKQFFGNEVQQPTEHITNPDWEAQDTKTVTVNGKKVERPVGAVSSGRVTEDSVPPTYEEVSGNKYHRYYSETEDIKGLNTITTYIEYKLWVYTKKGYLPPLQGTIALKGMFLGNAFRIIEQKLKGSGSMTSGILLTTEPPLHSSHSSGYILTTVYNDKTRRILGQKKQSYYRDNR